MLRPHTRTRFVTGVRAGLKRDWRAWVRNRRGPLSKSTILSLIGTLGALLFVFCTTVPPSEIATLLGLVGALTWFLQQATVFALALFLSMFVLLWPLWEIFKYFESKIRNSARVKWTQKPFDRTYRHKTYLDKAIRVTMILACCMMGPAAYLLICQTLTKTQVSPIEPVALGAYFLGLVSAAVGYVLEIVRKGLMDNYNLTEYYLMEFQHVQPKKPRIFFRAVSKFISETQTQFQLARLHELSEQIAFIQSLGQRSNVAGVNQRIDEMIAAAKAHDSRRFLSTLLKLSQYSHRGLKDYQENLGYRVRSPRRTQLRKAFASLTTKVAPSLAYVLILYLVYLLFRLVGLEVPVRP